MAIEKIWQHGLFVQETYGDQRFEFGANEQEVRLHMKTGDIVLAIRPHQVPLRVHELLESAVKSGLITEEEFKDYRETFVQLGMDMFQVHLRLP